MFQQGKGLKEAKEGQNEESMKTENKDVNLKKKKKNKRKNNETSKSKDKPHTKKDKIVQKKKLKQRKKNVKKALVEGKLQTVEDLNEIMLSESSENNQGKNQKTERKGGKRKNIDCKFSLQFSFVIKLYCQKIL